ncbi:MAG: hypothetical protein ABIG71_02025 [Candidatus Uhrbacteria bacterium]
MSSFALPLQTTRRSRRSKGNVAVRAFRADLRPWNVLLGLTVSVLIICYLALTNGNATAGYELRTLEVKMNELRDATRRLELQTVALQSETRLAERIADMGYVPVAHVAYLSGRQAVAQR